MFVQSPSMEGILIMMNLEQVTQHFLAQNNTLGYRVQKAIEYREAAQRGEMSVDEYQELLTDLQRLDDIQLSANELEQKIAFNEVLNALMALPI